MLSQSLESLYSIIPLWHQKASHRADGAILWDYHVICIQVGSKFFHIVHAPIYLWNFASDRRHMKDLDGNCNANPPTYDRITTKVFTEKLRVVIGENQLEDFFSQISLCA
ncbi:hypothetical protein UlMin_005991 [Ulmus minor]